MPAEEDVHENTLEAERWYPTESVPPTPQKWHQGVLENLPMNLIAQVVRKTIKIAYHIVRDPQTFLEERQDFQVRIQVQIKPLEELGNLLSDPAISQAIQSRDHYTYFKVMQKLHRLLFDFVVATEPQTVAAKQFIQEVSAEKLFRQIESSDPTLANPSPAEEKFWLRAKENVLWMVYRKEKVEKLVLEVEAWGDCLAKLISTTIRVIVIREQFSAEAIASSATLRAVTDETEQTQVTAATEPVTLVAESKSRQEDEDELVLVSLKEALDLAEEDGPEVYSTNYFANE